MYSLNEKDFGNIIFILKMCDDIKLYQEDEKVTNLLKKRVSLNAILLNLMQIGEHSNKLTDEFIQEEDENYWKQLIGIRHRITHDYGGIDLSRIEEIIRIHIDILIEKCMNIIKNFSKNSDYSSLINDKSFLENFNSKYMINKVNGEIY